MVKSDTVWAYILVCILVVTAFLLGCEIGLKNGKTAYQQELAKLGYAEYCISADGSPKFRLYPTEIKSVNFIKIHFKDGRTNLLVYLNGKYNCVYVAPANNLDINIFSALSMVASLKDMETIDCKRIMEKEVDIPDNWEDAVKNFK